jgi:hypothetical protein
MTRTIITIAEQDRDWLASHSRSKRQSMAETVRQAIHRYREEISAESDGCVLRETAGLWRTRGKDGLEYQRELRGEWAGDER